LCYYYVTFVKENFINFVVNIYSMGGEYTNLDKKMEQLPSETMYGIYEGILRAMKEGGIKAEEKDNTIIIDIGDPTKESYLTIRQDKGENRTEIHYKVSGETAKKLAMGIGRHFPIFEGLNNLADNLSYVEVWTRIRNEKRCESGREYCGKISVDIKMVGKPYRNSKQDETQPQQPTELGVRLAKSSLEELLNLVANGNVGVSVFPNNESIYITRKDEEPIFVQHPSLERGSQSYTVSGKPAEDLIEEIGRYIPLPEELKNAKNVRVTWEYSPHGYIIGFDTETEPRKPINFSK
jgi:hypothetical protein